MSLGSRIPARAKAVAAAGLSSLIPREPLLFLYPQWVRKSSTASSTSKPSRQKSKRQRTSDFNPGDAGTKAAPPNEQGRNKKASAYKPRPIQIKKIAPKLVRHTAETTVIRKTETTVVRKLISFRASAEARAQSAFWRRKAYQEKVRLKRGADVPDWRVILATLVEHTPDAGRWLDKAINIVVPKDADGELLLGVDNDIWSIAFRHGCSVALTKMGVGEDGHRRFVLSGPVNNIVKAAGDILRIAPTAALESTTKDLEIPPDLSEVQTTDDAFLAKQTTEGSIETIDAAGKSRVRMTMVESRGRILMTMNATEVPRPEKWTVDSFNDFVQYLTSAEMPNHLHRLMYDIKKDHIESVIEVLSSVFMDPECKHVISRKAYNAAMQYFVATNRIADARCLFVRMEMINFQMDTETFNILLRGAAKNNDLSNFQLVLNLMLGRNHTPNAGTFIAFLQTFTDIRIKSYILSAMEKKQLLNHKSSLKDACESIVRDEIEKSLQDNQTEEAFMNQMDARYGPDWLTLGSGNRIIHSLGSRWLISRCWSFVKMMKARFIEPDKVSLNTILHHCKHMRNLEGAVEVIKNWPTNLQFGLAMDQMSYHTLFEMAWRRRMHNVARVVWRYACLDAATTSWMRTLVYNSVKVGMGLKSTLRRRPPLKRHETENKMVAEGNQDYLRLLEVVAETSDTSGEQQAADKAEESPSPGPDPTSVPSIVTNTDSVSSNADLNHFGHVPKPNNPRKMFNRTAGLFITGISNFASHPMEDPSLNLDGLSSWNSNILVPLNSSHQPFLRSSKSHNLYLRVTQVPSLKSILAHTVSTLHSAEPIPVKEDAYTEIEKKLIVQRQLLRDRAVWQDWQPVEDFKTALSRAYMKDMEWRQQETSEEARSLEWMLKRKMNVLVRRKNLKPHDLVKRWN